MSQADSLDIIQHNAAAWDEQARAQHAWSKPVTADVIFA